MQRLSEGEKRWTRRGDTGHLRTRGNGKRLNWRITGNDLAGGVLGTTLIVRSHERGSHCKEKHKKEGCGKGFHLDGISKVLEVKKLRPKEKKSWNVRRLQERDHQQGFAG